MRYEVFVEAHICEFGDLLGYTRANLRVSNAVPRSSYHEAKYHSGLRDADRPPEHGPVAVRLAQ